LGNLRAGANEKRSAEAPRLNQWLVARMERSAIRENSYRFSG
jgi:hypothetical protein